MLPSSERRRLLGLPLAWCAAEAMAQARPGNVIRLGQSVPASGPAQQLGIEYARGWRIAIDAANAAGWPGGQRIELITYDDAYEPERALANSQDLLRSDQVFALVGYVGTASIERCLPLAIEAGVPFIAGLSGAESLRRYPSRWLWHLRPGLDAELGLIASNFATLGLQRFSLLVQDDGEGGAGLDSWNRVARDHGLPAAAQVVRVQRNSTAQVALNALDIRLAADRLMADQPQAVICVAAYASTAAVVKRLRLQRFRGGCFATSLSSAAAISDLLGEHTAGLNVTQVVPSPFDVSMPVVAAYQRALAQTSRARPEYSSLEGWIAAQALLEALRRMPRGGSRAQLMNALESLNHYAMGGLSLNWDPVHRQALTQVSLTVLDAHGRPRH
jgi:branched-chain amino acid transport system substrate-binding protein